MHTTRLFHTVRHLRLRQVTGRAVRSLRFPRFNRHPIAGLRSLKGPWVPPITQPPALTPPETFRFLNREYPVTSPADWNDQDRPKLWLYNLHYFDDLNSDGSAGRAAVHRDLILRWVAENPVGHGNGWEPYPISLRIVNWIKWALDGNKLPTEATQSLAVQARHLRRNLEYHLLGNHLWANGKALVFAGLCFEGPEAEEWLGKGQGILDAEIPEQILPDGGHFERSPMYHAIVLEDLLDLANLFAASGRGFPASWGFGLARMRQWLAIMTHPDGRFPLFNDAAYGVAPEAIDLEAYALRLGLGSSPPVTPGLVCLPETGYVRVATGEAVAFLDVAPIGPDYIPGHAHADTLNFELSLFGRPVIVDSGTSTYEKDSERQRQRGTAAHNTVEIDGEDSSEVWGGFRVARRARPLDLQVTEDENSLRVSCSHDGYRRLPGRPTHRREWSLEKDTLTIRDRLEGDFHTAVGRFHFHPEVAVTLTGPGEGRGELPDSQTFWYKIDGGTARLVRKTYHPEFGLSISNTCLEVDFQRRESQIRFNWPAPKAAASSTI